MYHYELPVSDDERHEQACEREEELVDTSACVCCCVHGTQLPLSHREVFSSRPMSLRQASQGDRSDITNERLAHSPDTVFHNITLMR